MIIDTALDPNDARIASTATGLLGEFNIAGVIDSADVHVATMLGRVAGETGEAVLLAAACVVAATRAGSVCVDLESASDYFSVEAAAGIATDALPWPEPKRWLAEVAASPLLNAPNSALRLEGSRLYLDRYHRYEQDLCQQLIDRRRAGVPLDEELLSDGLDRLFPAGEQGGDAQQRLGAETAVRRQLAVLAGGPGTGKTTTIARIIALLHEQLLVNGRPPADWFGGAHRASRSATQRSSRRTSRRDERCRGCSRRVGRGRGEHVASVAWLATVQSEQVQTQCEEPIAPRCDHRGRIVDDQPGVDESAL